MAIWVVSNAKLLWMNLLWTSLYKFFCGGLFSFLLGTSLGVELLSHSFTFHEKQKYFSKWLHTFTFQPAVYERGVFAPHPCQPSAFLSAFLWRHSSNSLWFISAFPWRMMASVFCFLCFLFSLVFFFSFFANHISSLVKYLFKSLSRHSIPLSLSLSCYFIFLSIPPPLFFV